MSGSKGYRVDKRLIVVFAAVLALLFAPPQNAGAQVLVNSHQMKRGEYIIKRKFSGANAEGLISEKLAASHLNLRVKQELGGNLVVAPKYMPAIMGQDGEEDEFVPVDKADPTCTELVKSGVASYCEPNYKVEIKTLPNDPYFSVLWGLGAAQGIDAARAWDKSRGSSNVVVAVIDTGIDYNHPDLAANVWVNPGEVAGNGIDDDGNGYIDDRHGINVLNGSGNPMDDNGHGTHVAGTIGAVGNNGQGVVGVNWNVRIMGLKFLNARGAGSISGAVEAVNYMVAMKQRGVNVRISNNSWGGGGYSQSLYEAISRANAAGIIFVAAAGNEGNDNDASPAYPAGYELPNVVSVAALDQNQNLAWFSNYGAASVDIAAPGVAIRSTTPGGNYSSYSGTSMATPHVSGALALLLASEPSLSNSALIRRVYESGVELSSLSGVVRTGRALNAGRMLYNETRPVPAPAPETPSCQYNIGALSLPEDTRADNGTVIIQGADEYNYQVVNLPFAFDFDGSSFSSVTVSPNGLLYLGARSISSMDYQNGQNAPANSIAALHTDLVSTVRVALGAQSATFFWLGHHYANPQAGQALVRLTLRADGVIQKWINFTSPSIERAAQAAATVGISGRSASAHHTYAYNSSLIRNGLSLEYVPLCGLPAEAQPVRVNRLRMWGVEGKARGRKLVSTLTPGGRFRVQVSTSTQGLSRTVPVGFMLGSQMCNETRTIEVRPNNLSFSGRLPRAAASFKKFSVVLDQARATRRMQNMRSDTRVRRRGLSPQNFGRLCRSLGNSLRTLR